MNRGFVLKLEVTLMWEEFKKFLKGEIESRKHNDFKEIGTRN